MRQLQKKKDKGKMKSIGDFAGLIFVLILFSYPLIIKPSELVLLRFWGICTDAVITATLDSTNPRYCKASYYYRFSVDGEEYWGSSSIDDENKIGTTIRVLYLPFAPSIYARKAYFESGGIKCNCEKNENNCCGLLWNFDNPWRFIIKFTRGLCFNRIRNIWNINSIVFL